MNLGTYDITIDFSKLFVHNSTSIYFKEGDLNTARVRAKLTMQGKAIDITGCNILVKIETMTGGKINDVATIIDAVNGIVEIDFKSNSLVEGTNFFELKIVKGESVKESPKLAYRVLDSIEDAGSIEGTNEYPILIQLISDANKAIEDANEALELANTIKTNLEEVIDNANSAIGNATDATNNANTAATNATSKITEVDNAKNDMTTKVDESIDTMKLEVNSAKNDMKITVDEAIKFLKQEYNSLTAQQQEELEMLQARDGEVNLNTRLKRDLYINGKSLKQEVLDLGGLKEVQEMSYETDKGYLVCKETKVSTVKDMKIYGKSLVNLCKNKNSVINFTGDLVRWELNTILDMNKTYTAFINVEGLDSGASFVFATNTSNGTGTNPRKVAKNGVHICLIDPNEESRKDISAWSLNGQVSENPVKLSDVMVIEGDHTQNPPNEYFEGIASVGTSVDKIEVSSIKSDGNLFNGEITSTSSRGFSVENIDFSVIPKLGVFSFKTETKYNRNSLYLKANSPSYSRAIGLVSYNNGIAFGNYNLTDADLDIINENPKGMRIEVYRGDGDCDTPTNICINKGESPIPYQCYKEDKKPLLFKDSDGTWKPIKELRGLDTVCDTIELHSDGKYYHHQRTEKRVFNGSESWYKYTNVELLTTTYLSRIGNIKPKNILLCDKFNYVKWHDFINNNVDSITHVNSDHIYITHTESTTVESFKRWLQINPITVIYPLAEEKIFEVNPLFLESYENETMISFSRGSIAPYASWKITSYLPNFVMNLSKRVKRIEDDFYKYTVVQNRMQLGTTYSSDRTTFRVDTSVFTAEKAKQEVDYDLFRLLRHNILVGPQNYNKEEMESIMDFYVSIGKINYDMWDELYLLIEEQHNPPVEEETPIM